MIRWAKRLISIPIIIFAIVGFIFIFNPGDISPLSLPCFSDCHNRCSPLPSFGCTTEMVLDAPCFQDCRMRNFRCGVDPEFKEKCLNCFSDCQAEELEDINQMRECFSKCTEQNN